MSALELATELQNLREASLARAREARRTSAGSVVWVLLPLLTLGFATPWCLLFAGIRTRRPRHLVEFVVSLALAIVTLVVVARAPQPPPTAASVFIFTATALQWIGGFVLALVERRTVFRRTADPDNARAVAEVEERRQRRRQARALAERDPQAAVELLIGRPDLTRSYDDGGLVDLNHAPVAAIARMPGVTPEQAAAVVRAREQVGTFTSAEDVGAYAEIPPSLVPRLAEYGVFLP